jgi:hypothetical protein
MGTVSTNFLEVSSSELKPSDTDKSPDRDDDKTSTGGCTMYTVEPGDTLWGIAQAQLGDGNRYREIVERNKETYPSLENSANVRTGWQLNIGCDTPEEESGEKVEEQRSYDVNVRVLDATKNPVAGAEVTLHSTPRTATTNDDGIASFTDVEPGQHRVVIAYGDYTGEQSVNLSGDVKVFDLNVTVEEKDVALSRRAWTIIGILSGVIIVLMFLVFVYRKRR